MKKAEVEFSVISVIYTIKMLIYTIKMHFSSTFRLMETAANPCPAVSLPGLQ